MDGDRRPHVLIVITLAEVGGAQTYVAQLVPALLREYRVTVAAFGPGPLRSAVTAAGAGYVPLRHVRRPLSPRDLLGLVELVRLIRRVRPVVVHANSSKAGFLGRVAARLAGVPVVLFTVHGWAFKAASGLSARFYRVADRAMKPLTTTVICVSRTELEAGLRARTCRPDASVVIRNGVDATDDPPAALTGAPPLIVSVGRLAPPKTFATLVEALALLEPGSFRAAIAGDGPDRVAIEAAAGVNVEFLGERTDVPAILRRADVFVLSSASEGMPMSVLEAMAAGLPIVASSVGGLPELIGEAGILVPPNDPPALAAALRRLVSDRQLRAALGRAARDRARSEFSLHRTLEEHVALYARLLAAAP